MVGSSDPSVGSPSSEITTIGGQSKSIGNFDAIIVIFQSNEGEPW